MATVRISNPVAVSHPISQQFITLSKGMEFADTDPIVKTFAWAFEDQPEVEPVTSVKIQPKRRK